MLKYIELVAAYTQQHPELLSAHHFLYDLRSPPGSEPEYVVMGINPGESDTDWTISSSPTEETSRYDFHRELGPGRDGIPWVRSADFFLDRGAYAQTELFFWSSRDMVQFGERYGSLQKSAHLPFCTAMNVALIEAYQPKAVIFPGLGQARLCERLFDLRHTGTLSLAGVRLAERYSDGHRPWLFTKHWTGSFGFSREQREAVRMAIRSLSPEG